MVIEFIFSYGTGIIITLLDGTDSVGFIADGKDEAVRVLREHAPDDPELPPQIDRIFASEVPAFAGKPAERLDGAFVGSLGHLIDETLRAQGEGPSSMCITDSRSAVFELFTADDDDADDGMICYADEHGEHAITAFFSTRQGAAIVDAMTWLEPGDRAEIKRIINESRVAHDSDRQPVTITGTLARVLNTTAERCNDEENADADDDADSGADAPN